MDRGNNGTAAPVLICWKCKGGAKMPPEKQMQMNVGMFQVKAEEAAPIIAKKLEERILHYLS